MPAGSYVREYPVKNNVNLKERSDIWTLDETSAALCKEGEGCSGTRMQFMLPHGYR